MVIHTERLILRPWRLSDAVCLFAYAKDERVGPAAGWPPHQSVEESEEIIRRFFLQEGVFAVTQKGCDDVIGCVGLLAGACSNLPINDQEGEISYWLGVPFWGQGLIPEAVNALIRYGFEERGLSILWCGAFGENVQSKRVQEKCGFIYQYTRERPDDICNSVKRVEQVARLTREEWMNRHSRFCASL